jgi:DNA (cytosine-5)-methyltransferase 1
MTSRGSGLKVEAVSPGKSVDVPVVQEAKRLQKQNCGLENPRRLTAQSAVKFRLGELFAGAGGMALGAIQASTKFNGTLYSIVPVWANDYDEDACTTYRNNIMGDSEKVICRDVKKLTFDDLSEIDALAFGFPCNDFSAVGERKGTRGSFGPLYEYGVAALRHFKPKWFLAENVGGLHHTDEGEDLKKILREMREAGYDLFPHLYRFENYGVPQRRHRIMITGIRHDLHLVFRVPAPTTQVPRTARQALEEPPIPQGATNTEKTAQDAKVVERLKHIRPGENAFSADLPRHLKLNVPRAHISQIYRRLDPDLPSYTVTGSGGGGTHVYHWSEPRALTNRERARLQTFPDDFVFSGSKESVRRQIGMAVPPAAATVVFRAILATFAGAEYSHVNASMAPLLYDCKEPDAPFILCARGPGSRRAA